MELLANTQLINALLIFLSNFTWFVIWLHQRRTIKYYREKWMNERDRHAGTIETAMKASMHHESLKQFQEKVMR